MTDHGLLTLTQWLSPAFPIGAYAYSHGLETAISEGQVTSADTLETWLQDVLQHGAGRTDAIVLVRALAGDPLDDLDAVARALCATRERQVETVEQGAAFTRTVNALTGEERPALTLPVAVGAAAARLGLAPEQVIGLYLHAFLSNLVSVAVRFVPLGQTEGQAVLARLHPLIGALANEVQGLGLSDIGTAAFGADMAALRHEDLIVRLFKT